MANQNAPDGFEHEDARYIVGIDLGTTNCAVSFVDTTADSANIQSFPIEQWVDFPSRERRDLLPSFLYQPLDSEHATLCDAGFSKDADHIVGTLARDRGLAQPARQIQSAKSWLCHAGVDRREKILPWQSDESVERLSPVDASSLVLGEIRAAWDSGHKQHPLHEQEIILTLPASFDQVARQLTIDAAAQAGLKRILPIEEPQAAFYAWLARHDTDWEAKVSAGQSILVCDIGGGTTDFTLIRVRESSQQAADGEADVSQSTSGKLTLHRVAVGQHLILGGDNIDLSLATLLESKLKSDGQLSPRDWEALRQASRVAKEVLLSDSAPPSYTVHLPSAGSKLIGGGRSVEVLASDIDTCVLDGFFPQCSLEDRPVKQKVGFQEFGLPFATDAAITKHLAEFLWEHRFAGRTDSQAQSMSDLTAARPDWILFNGGVMASDKIRQRVLNTINHWFQPTDETWKIGILDGDRLDRAVASGAAYFGQVRRGQGVQIEAKLASSFYLQTSENPPQAICIVPGSASPGDSFSLSELPLELAIGQPVQFPIVYSSARLADPAGKHVELNDEQFRSLPPIRTVIEASRKLAGSTMPVTLQVQLSEIGTLQLYCQSTETDHRWKLEFDVRGSSQTDHDAKEASTADQLLDETVHQAAQGVLQSAFDSFEQKPGKVANSLVKAIELPRSQWPPSLLRAMWSDLIELAGGRRKSPAHEARWLNLLGYCLRPGYGVAADDWRVAETWKTVNGKLAHSDVTSRNEAMILWRRIAGGFTPGQQLTVYQQVAGPLRSILDPVRRSKGGGGASPAELIELLRLVGALELLPTSEKTQLGDWLVELVHKKKWQASQSAILWALGRLGSRTPTYAPLNCVLPPDVASRWLRKLVRQPASESAYALTLMLCARKVDDRYRDLDPDMRSDVLATLKAIEAPDHYLKLVSDGGTLASEEETQILGDSLPLGLRLG
ncbi:MAG: Hsp70 family protein [Aureliella sp.]